MANHENRALNFWLLLLGVICCQGCEESCIVKQESFAHEQRSAFTTAAWGGMRVDWIAVADWPIGDSIVAKAARVWIGDRLRNGGEKFGGDLADWDAVTRFYGNCFLANNGSKKIEAEWRAPAGERDDPRTGEPESKPGADVFLEDRAEWFCRRTALIAYEDERIVSYRSGFYGSFVGNATSAAYVKCATFRKSDGKILGWDAFANTNAVFDVVRELAKIQFKQNADIYGNGVPMPNAPLFTKDGFWCFWGDYAIVEPHVYEMKGEFPSLFIPWGDSSCGNRLSGRRESIENLLTQEAITDLGITKQKR
ncbi:MAG: hypothetical protein IJI36_06645 [Kiritimatiellae bacterium]|nr:hypothetical protein [Kiritimatiellia bacterium]